MDLKKCEKTIEEFRELIKEISFSDLINEGYFNNQMEFPRNDNLRVTCKCCGHTYKDEEKVAEYHKARTEYNKETNRLITLFQDALAIEFDVEGNEKSSRVFHLAWERGHSCGLYEVYQNYEELVDLIL
jgi:hypothetical protein